MTTHSNILAWKTPCTEEPGVLQSWGGKSQTQCTDTQCLNRQKCRGNAKCLFLVVNISLGTFFFLYLYFKMLLL